MITSAILERCYPHAQANAIARFVEPLNACMTRYDISTPLRQEHFLAQIGHESGQLRYTEEIASGSAYEGRRDLGNTQPGDGRRFKGRGLIQLTGRANYSAYQAALTETYPGIDLLATPEILATDTTLAADVAGWFWSRAGLNTWADRDDVRHITRRINGGYNGLADRIDLLNRARRAITGTADTAHGLSVRHIQDALNRAINAGLAEDGVSGPLTMAKVREFQQRNGLAVDGVVGPITAAKLREYLP
jgi:putative chitinase